MTDYIVRPFCEDDRPTIVEMGNRDRPPHRHGTVTGGRYWETMKPAGLVEIRLVAADPETNLPIASMGATDLGTQSWKIEDVVGFGIMVGHEYRRQGIGAMFYEKAFAFAQERGAKRMVTGFSEHSPDEPAIAFLQKRGFTEQEREKPSYLDLRTWDPTPLLPAIAKAETDGFRLFSYADVEDTEENRRKLYDLFVPLIYDIPRRDDQPFTVEPFEPWAKTTFDNPNFKAELFQLAEKDGQWVGLSHVMPKFETDSVSQWLTGVSREARGHGLSLAMKVRSYVTAKEMGYTVMTTENHEDNGPMLAVNKKFGFIPEPQDVSYNKVL